MITKLIYGFVLVIVYVVYLLYSMNPADHSYNIVKGSEEINDIEYPYLRYYKQEEEVKQAFKNLQDYTLDIAHQPYTIINMPSLEPEQLQYKDQPSIIKIEPDYWYMMNYLSDYFNEHIRVRCRRYDEPTPIQYWQHNKDSIYKKLGDRDQSRSDKIRLLNKMVYSKVIGCNTFKPSLVVGICKMYKISSMLDISAGWGDRLIGAIAAGIKYTGVDPNPDLFPGYQEIINTFARDLDLYTMINARFQDASLPYQLVDLVLSSPPYFNLEVYDGPGQSINQFPTLDAWLSGFLYISFLRALKSLRESGHICINLNDRRYEASFTLPLLLFASYIPGLDYLGVISYSKFKDNKQLSPQPIWIWQKSRQHTWIDLTGLYLDGEIPHKFQADTDWISFKSRYDYLHQKDMIAIGSSWHDTPYNGMLITTQDQKHMTDSIFLGYTHYEGNEYKVYHKVSLNINPVMIVDLITYNGKKFRIVRDDLVPGGTYQRAYKVLEDIKHTHIQYQTCWADYIQTSVCVWCKYWNKSAVIATKYNDYYPCIRSIMYGGSLISLDKASKDDSIYQLHDDMIRKYLTSGIEEVNSLDPNGKYRIWVLDSILLDSLYDIYSRASFHVVQLGGISTRHIRRDRTTLYVSPESLDDDPEYVPPYPSNTKMDAKIWRFIIEYGEDNDIIWNTSGHNNRIK